jgi:hypothetical protein
MTDSLELVPLDDAELATIVGGLAPLLLVAATALITTVVKDFVDHVGDFAGGVKDGWDAAR